MTSTAATVPKPNGSAAHSDMFKPDLSWSIQPCTREHADEVAAQTLSSYDDDYRATGRPPFPRDFWHGVIKLLLSNPNQHGLIAVDDSNNKVIGSVFADLSDDGFTTMGPFTVLTDYANHGVARKLVQKLMDDCLRGNAQRILILTQSPSNVKAYALYSKLGFQTRLGALSLKGFATKSVDNKSTDIEVHRLTPSDADEATELLKTTLSGVDRRNYMNNMLNPKLNGNAVGYVARSKTDRAVIGFTTAANTAEGIWVYASAAAFRTLYQHASNDLRTYNDDLKYIPSVYLPQACYSELRWLLDIGVKLHRQLNLMSVNELNIRDGYIYCPSAYG